MAVRTEPGALPRLPVMAERNADQAWHSLAAADVLTALGAGPDGLDQPSAAQRLAAFGPNTLPRAQPPSWLRLFLRQFKSPLIYLLLVAAVISVGIGETSDAVFIMLVLLINAAIGAVNEGHAARSAAALDQLLEPMALVRRAGRRQQIAAALLVPGDLVLIESGVAVPADLRLLDSQDLVVDQSLLTGESLPVEKQAELLLPPATPLADRRNLLHAGTTVLTGRARGLVIATGAGTELGAIATALATGVAAPPPLVIRLERLTRQLTIGTVILVVLIGLGLLLRGAAPLDVFYLAVALAVAAIPEGLPVAITIALAVASQRMAKRNVIVRHLPAVEGLGACSLIASDKTGTLTCNRLTIQRLILAEGAGIEVAGEGLSLAGELTLTDGSPLPRAIASRAERLAMAGLLCNEASLQIGPDGTEAVGDRVDVAFLVLAEKLGLGVAELRRRHPASWLLAYEPERRFAASVNRRGDHLAVHVKGAPEAVLPRCRGAGGRLVAQAEQLAAAGFRVLAVAEGEVTPVEAFAEDQLWQLEPLGLVGLIDPLRPEVPTALARCRAAGVQVRMVTGDHPATAAAIARALGLLGPAAAAEGGGRNSEPGEARAARPAALAAAPAAAFGAPPAAPDQVLTGQRLQALLAADDQPALDRAIGAAAVFARVEPVQKLAIVQSLQRQGHFVAVTGDGANDAPALRSAHIGVAMGQSGTDIARQAADLILTDDNFASVVSGVEEGRIAYDNVRKLVWFAISLGLAEVLPFVGAILLDLPLPLFPAQLLWLNLVTDSLQFVALAFERGEPDTLSRPPRPPAEGLFDRRLISQILATGLVMGAIATGFWWWSLASGWDQASARNALLLLMVLFENAQALNCRSERRSLLAMPVTGNPFLLLAILGSLAIHLGAMWTPGVSDVLRLAPLDLDAWLTVLPLALVPILVVELVKRLWR